MGIFERRSLLRPLKILMGAVVVLPWVGQPPLLAADRTADADDAAVMSPKAEKAEVENPEMKKAEVTAERDLNEKEVDKDQDMTGTTHQGKADQERDLERQDRQAEREMKEAERGDHQTQVGVDNKGREIEKEVPEVRNNSDKQGGETGGGGHDGGDGGDHGGGKKGKH